jgi:hypothetical protein
MNAAVYREDLERVTIPGLPPHQHVIGRCDRWGTFVLWTQHVGVWQCGPKPVRSWYGPMILDRNVAQKWQDERDKAPCDPVEAMETDKAIRRLPPELCAVITLEHAVRGTRQRPITQEMKAKMLEISRTTYWRRCNDAYRLLLGIMNDIACNL